MEIPSRKSNLGGGRHHESTEQSSLGGLAGQAKNNQDPAVDFGTAGFLFGANNNIESPMDIKSIRQRFAAADKPASVDSPTSMTEKQLADWSEVFDTRGGQFINIPEADCPRVVMCSVPLAEVVSRSPSKIINANSTLRTSLSRMGYGPEYHLDVKGDNDIARGILIVCANLRNRLDDWPLKPQVVTMRYADGQMEFYVPERATETYIPRSFARSSYAVVALKEGIRTYGWPPTTGVLLDLESSIQRTSSGKPIIQAALCCVTKDGETFRQTASIISDGKQGVQYTIPMFPGRFATVTQEQMEAL